VADGHAAALAFQPDDGGMPAQDFGFSLGLECLRQRKVEAMMIYTNKQHRDVHTAKVEHDVALRVIAECVAEELGVSLDSPTVSYRAYITSRSTSTRYTYEVEVEIIDDHAAIVTAAKTPTQTRMCCAYPAMRTGARPDAMRPRHGRTWDTGTACNGTAHSNRLGSRRVVGALLSVRRGVCHVDPTGATPDPAKVARRVRCGLSVCLTRRP